jgi:hypothetical protein
VGAGTTATVHTGVVPAGERAMGVAVVPAGERAMVVGLSRHKVGLAAGAKPLRAGLAGVVKPPRATPTDRDLGGAGRACVEDPSPSNLSK